MPKTGKELERIAKQQAEKELELLWATAANQFTVANPEYKICSQNYQLMLNFLNEKNLDKRFVGSYQIAYDALRQRELSTGEELFEVHERAKPKLVEEELTPQEIHKKEIAALRAMPLKDLAKQVAQETSSARNHYSRRGIFHS